MDKYFCYFWGLVYLKLLIVDGKGDDPVKLFLSSTLIQFTAFAWAVSFLLLQIFRRGFILSRYSKIILTGATGWLGTRIATALTEGLSQLGSLGSGGKTIKCLVKKDENAEKLLNLGAEIHYGDILDEECCADLMTDCENSLVIHTAGLIHPKLFTREFTRINLNGTLNLLNAAATVKAFRFVVISSNSPIGLIRPLSIVSMRIPRITHIWLMENPKKVWKKL